MLGRLCVTKPSIVRTRRTDEAEITAPNLALKTKPLAASVLEEARRTGLLEGDKSEHVSFRAPPALVAAAKREIGISSTSELGVPALAMLARPNPVTAFFRGREADTAAVPAYRHGAAISLLGGARGTRGLRS